MLHRLSYRLTDLPSALFTAVLLTFVVHSSSRATDFPRISVDEAIRQSRQVHEMERQMKSRQLQKQRDLQGELGVLGALPTQYQYDVHYYRIDMRVNVPAETIYARVDMMSTATQDNVTFCEIDLYSNMIIDSIRVDDGPATYSRNGNLVTVFLPSPVNTGEEFAVYTFYRGHPIEGGLQAFAFETTPTGDPLISTLSEPFMARTWWPCKDYPDDKADSVDIIITYPANLFCSSNGKMISNIDNGNGTRTTTWKERYPIATYLISLAMSNYVTWRDWFHYTPTDSMPVDYWVYPSQLAAAQSAYAVTVPMLDTLSGIFGLYPFVNEKYAMSMFNWSGAMEHQTNTSILYNWMDQMVIVHEMGHQWWGDMVTCRDWHHVWTNEGFASYTEALWYESLGGFTGLRNYMNGMRYTSGGSIYRTDTVNVYSIFNNIVYDKAAWVLHALRHVVGDQTFFDILHAYYADPRYKWKDINTEDFRDLCEDISGIDLHGFFSDWIYGTYYPKYSYSFTYDQLSTSSYRVYVHVRQTQTTNPTVFDMPTIDVSVYNGGYIDFHVPMMEREKDYVFTLSNVLAAPSAVAVDRNDWILKTAASETYTVHIIYDSLMTGAQYAAYQDSVIVRGGTKPYSFQITGGSLPAGLSLNAATGAISGTPTDSGTTSITVQVTATGGATDSKPITFRIVPSAGYVYGDANGDRAVEVGDAVYLISYIFGGGSEPNPLTAGDANGDCVIDVSDVVYLVSFIFSSGTPPLPGC